jgi:FdhD protein
VAGKSASRTQIRRVDGTRALVQEDEVATEEPLEIRLTFGPPEARVTRSVSVTMRTPGADRELATGFLFGEGILTSPAQLECPTEQARSSAAANVVTLTLREGSDVDLARLERNFYMSSSCGVCGKSSLAALSMAREAFLDARHPIVSAETIHALPAALRAAQSVFASTGGLHAAGLFDADGTLVDVREDVGRHNAVDKVVGGHFLAGRLPLRDHILLVSGRASFELVQKTLMAGIPVFAAVGAPSSLAIDVARAYGLTLVGFVRDARFNIYSGEQRVVVQQGETQHVPETEHEEGPPAAAPAHAARP